MEKQNIAQKIKFSVHSAEQRNKKVKLRWFVLECVF